MKPQKSRLIFTFLLLAFILIIWSLFFRLKAIAIILDGEIIGISTNALTVKGALLEADISFHEVDDISPGLYHFVKNKDIIKLDHASLYTIVNNESVYTIWSTNRSPNSLLKMINLELAANDQLYIDGIKHNTQNDLSYAVYHQIEIIPKQRIQININSEPHTFSTADTSIAELLWDNYPIFRLGDNFSHPLQISPFSNILFQYVINQEKSIRSNMTDIAILWQSDAIGDSFSLAGLPLQFIDYSIPSENDLSVEGDIIKSIYVREEVVLDQQIINFDLQKQPLPELEIDNQQIVQAGEYGLEARRIRIRIENGEEVNRKEEDSWIVRTPIPRIEGYGTKINIKSMNTPDGPIEYWRALQFYATSYSASRSGVSTDKSWYGHVYCGGMLKKGFVAVDLDYIPCGTQLYIPGYGFAVAMDTGGFSGAWIDLGYDDDNYVPWHETVTVYFLTPVPSLDNISWVIPPGTTN